MHSIVTKYLSQDIFEIMGIKHIGGHDLDLSGLRNVIGHVTIRFSGSHFLRAPHCHQVAISSRFRDNGQQTYWGHDLDLSGSRNVIGHVTIRFPGHHFLYALHCHQFAISSSPVVSEIMATKYVGVMILTFLGHVTSSVT